MEPVFEHYKDREEHTAKLADDALVLQNQINIAEDNVNSSPVSWANLQLDEDRCRLICGFSPKEFRDLYNIVEDDIEENIGRELRSKISKEDKLLMTLCYLKHYETIDKIRDTFSISKSYIHTILSKTINSIPPVLYEYYVIDLEDRLDDNEEKYKLFPDAKFVMDVTFQSIWTPTGTYEEKKVYFSGKHKMYGLKSQCIHNRKGLLVHCIPGQVGSTHDLTICKNNMKEVKEVFEKDDDEDSYYSVLVDSGYQGLQEYTDCFLSFKKKNK
jgi:hypothetical protein